VSYANHGICELLEHSEGLAMMNIGIRAVEVAEGLLHPVGLGLEHVPAMRRFTYRLPCHCESKFERHVESRCRRPLRVKFNA